jgi:hypothetical protein
MNEWTIIITESIIIKELNQETIIITESRWGTGYQDCPLVYQSLMNFYFVGQGTATALHPLTVAAHQPVWQIWNFAAFGHTPLEQAALAYIPTAAGRFEERETIKVGCQYFPLDDS